MAHAAFRAIENGANVSLVEYIRDGHGGWGLLAKTDVQANETLLNIPVRIAIHGDNVTDHPIIGELFTYAKRYDLYAPNFDVSYCLNYLHLSCFLSF